MSDEKWSGYVKLTDKGIDFIKEFGDMTRKRLENPATEERECYSCNRKIEGKANFIEWIPLFMRYICICDECHEKHDKGEFVEVIQMYEKVLAGLCTQHDYMKVYYKYHPDKFNEFLEKFPIEQRKTVRSWFE